MMGLCTENQIDKLCGAVQEEYQCCCARWQLFADVLSMHVNPQPYFAMACVPKLSTQVFEALGRQRPSFYVNNLSAPPLFGEVPSL